MSSHGQGVCASGTMICLLRVVLESIRENITWFKPIDFYALSWGSFRKTHEI